MFYKGYLASFFCLFYLPLFCQSPLVEMHSYYDDDIVEWDLYTEDEDGKLEMTWAINYDKTEWNYSLSDYSGIIRKKWKGDSNLWELSNYQGNTIEFAPKWRDDLSEWQITNGDKVLIFRTVRTNDYNEWTSHRSSIGEIIIYTDYLHDPRDWIIESNLDEDISFEYSLVCSFICMHYAYGF